MSNSMGSVLEAMETEVTGSGAKFAPAASGVFISPWTRDSNQTNHYTVFEHGLGVVPQSLLVLFSADQDTVYPVQWPWDNNYAGNPVTISMTDKSITLGIFHGSPLHGAWEADQGIWNTYKSGYWMVIAKAAA